MSRSRALALLAAGLAAACAATLTTNVRSDPAADFSAYKTFAVETARLETDAQENLRREITGRLEAKGLRLADRNPDLEVVPRLIRDASQRAEDTGYGWWTEGATSESTTGLAVGTLVVDLVDPAKKQLVWRGEATGTIPSSGALRRDKLQLALDRLFAQFPPKPKEVVK